ncbi:L-sorbose 1-dehydrogenase-like [Oppia nitens]|uniref:L-sorbose 1-dehydrogenase-like n=1 Tax=Oppia nitens TaxID=1686743 RepID=UPI0023DA3E0C|nr:L-sorbose 1-dehydrogenase-like [Oppia nitens]
MAPPLVGISIQLLSIAALILQNNIQHDSVETSVHQIQAVYDFIVVGSGSSGAIVANRLAENPHIRVLLVEAGGPSGLINDIPAQTATGALFYSEQDWNYTLTPQKYGVSYQNRVIPENRGHVIGGTSSFNSMIYNRGNRRTFDVWAKEYGAIGWSYEEVLPYFMKYEKNLDPLVASNGFHGTTGPIEITSWSHPPPIIQLHQQAANELHIPSTDINGAQQFGTAVCQAFIDGKGRRSSASNAYIDPNPYPHNLHILARALVTKILFEDKRAVGIQFLRHGTEHKIFAKKEIIVSAGTINTPQLLMLSGIGPEKHLHDLGIPVLSDLPVGDNYQNHWGVSIDFAIKEKYYHLLSTGGQMNVPQLYQFLARKTGPLAQHYRTVVYYNTHNNKDKDWPNTNWETGLYLYPANLSDVRAFPHEDRHAWDIFRAPLLGRYYFFVHPILQRPRSVGSIRLASKSPLYYPLIDGNVLADPKDYADLHESIKAALYFYERSSIAEYLEPIEPIPGCQFCKDRQFVNECDEYIQCLIVQTAYSCYHPAGTARMGAHERHDTVVDPRLRVKGVDGLRVCDASVMPLLMNGNTNAASLMIGEKCADLVKHDNQLA